MLNADELIACFFVPGQPCRSCWWLFGRGRKKAVEDLILVDKHFPFPRWAIAGLKRRESIGNDRNYCCFGLSLLVFRNALSRYSDGDQLLFADRLAFEGTVDRIAGRFEAWDGDRQVYC